MSIAIHGIIKSNHQSVLLLILVLLVPIGIYKIYDYYDNKHVVLPYLGKKSPEGNAYQVAPFSLTDHNNEVFNLTDFKGKRIVLDFFFTRCPTICPVMSKNMKYLYTELEEEDDLVFISISIDPDFDQPEILQRYRKRLGIEEDRWLFLTGDEKDIYNMARNVFFISALPPKVSIEEIIHSDKFIILDGDFHIRAYYSGTDIEEVNQLKADIKNPKKWL
jgi:protein SCO1